MTTKEFINNLIELIYRLAEKTNTVEIDHYNTDKNTIILSIRTLTSVSDPSVNYYEDGWDSIEEFAIKVAELFYVKTEVKKDLCMGGNIYDDWVVRDGWLKVTI